MTIRIKNIRLRVRYNNLLKTPTIELFKLEEKGFRYIFGIGIGFCFSDIKGVSRV